MSLADDAEEKFVIKHFFKDVKHQLRNETDMIGPVEKHHGLEWKLRLVKTDCGENKFIELNLDCVQAGAPCEWSIETEFEVYADGKFVTDFGEFIYTNNCGSQNEPILLNYSGYDDYSSKENLEIEFRVTIRKMTGIGKKNLRNFDKEKFSDIVFVIGGEKFYVLKKFLAMHSTYFESMFSGSFQESEISEIELKNINSEHFQNFLELINGESLVNDHNVEGILHLADFFGAKTAMKRCQEFLHKRSELPLKRKFDAAIKGSLDNVKRMCFSEMSSKEDVKKVLPEDPAHFHPTVWAEIVDKLFSLK